MKTDYKKHIYSNDPLVETYHNIISTEECQHFINLSKNKLKKSLVSVGKKGVVSKGRSSQNTWIKHDYDNITKKVGERIAKIVGMSLENAEAFQLIYYDVSQEYRQHYDSWIHDGSEKTLRCMKYGGARIKTALCYLNNVEKGGGTKMTKLGMTIPAIKGNMLVFNNTIGLNNHNRHPLSEHAGLPVEKGEKYAFNLWFRECNSKILYSTFNPEYYKTDKDTNNNISLSITKKNKNYLPETLQIGDYIPFIEIDGNIFKKHIHNYCNEKLFMFITLQNITGKHLDSTLLSLSNNFNIIVLYEKGTPNIIENNIVYTSDKQLRRILKINIEPTVYITCPNRRISSIMNMNTVIKMIKINTFKIENFLPKQVHIPYLLIEDALDDLLLKKIISFYDIKKKNGQLITHKHSTKDRLHVYPDSELEKELDHKLSRSVLPELRKVFNFDAQYRELYKICEYDGETSGRFHAHRDTPAPYQHRKYAMSLFINDNYEGGEFVLPEYGLTIKPKGILHLYFQVLILIKYYQ